MSDDCIVLDDSDEEVAAAAPPPKRTRRAAEDDGAGGVEIVAPPAPAPMATDDGDNDDDDDDDEIRVIGATGEVRLRTGTRGPRLVALTQGKLRHNFGGGFRRRCSAPLPLPRLLLLAWRRRRPPPLFLLCKRFVYPHNFGGALRLRSRTFRTRGTRASTFLSP
jgi:hypothetical protein